MKSRNINHHMTRVAYETVSILVSSAIIIFLVFTFLLRFAGVVGDSMNPTLTSGNWVALSQVGEYEPSRGDVVVISQPNALDENIIKRVIATEGQTIDINFDTGDVIVDGEVLDEPYINNPTTTSFDLSFPMTIPEGYVFVMGDNRQNSMDSRCSEIGLIRTDYILGKAVAAYGVEGFRTLS